MSFRDTAPLPIAPFDYDAVDQERLREIITENLLQLGNDLAQVETFERKTSSLAMRRHQFLLMGAT